MQKINGIDCVIMALSKLVFPLNLINKKKPKKKAYVVRSNDNVKLRRSLAFRCL